MWHSPLVHYDGHHRVSPVEWKCLVGATRSWRFCCALFGWSWLWLSSADSLLIPWKINLVIFRHSWQISIHMSDISMINAFFCCATLDNASKVQFIRWSYFVLTSLCTLLLQCTLPVVIFTGYYNFVVRKNFFFEAKQWTWRCFTGLRGQKCVLFQPVFIFFFRWETTH